MYGDDITLSFMFPYSHYLSISLSLSPFDLSALFPSSGCPWFPGSGCPWFQGSGCPWFPSSGCPWFQGSGCPWFPGSGCPWFPGSECPWFPGSGCPWFNKIKYIFSWMLEIIWIKIKYILWSLLALSVMNKNKHEKVLISLLLQLLFYRHLKPRFCLFWTLKSMGLRLCRLHE